MENEQFYGYEDFGLPFTSVEFALIFTGVALMRLIPLLILLSALVKYRRFPHLRPLHGLLLAEVALLAALTVVDTFAPALVPDAIRANNVWSFVWIFAIAWVAVTWVRSAIKTRLRPRLLDISILIASAALLLTLAIPLGANW